MRSRSLQAKQQRRLPQAQYLIEVSAGTRAEIPGLGSPGAQRSAWLRNTPPGRYPKARRRVDLKARLNLGYKDCLTVRPPIGSLTPPLREAQR